MQKSRRTKGIRVLSSEKARTILMQNLLEWNTPRSLAIWMILDGGNDADVLSLTDHPPEAFNSAVAWVEYSYPTDLVRKSRLLDLGINTRAAAVLRFHEAEELCRESNSRLRYHRDPTGRLGELLRRVRKIIYDTLPELTTSALNDFVETGGWGKGVTSAVKRRHAGKPNWATFCSKLVSHQHSTEGLLPVARQLQAEVTGMDGEVTVRNYNSVCFVSKNAKTDRAIAVEPSLNAYLQRGAGLLIRSGLRRLGVDLVHGQRRNAALARIGSSDGSMATVDLSMASDTICRKAVPYLLPSDWSSLLLLLRTSHYQLDGAVEPYQKWSSMGNGYTFELESLIFAACAKAVSGGADWAVYGDDIVVPSAAVPDLASLLSHLGFVFNPEKSFTSGPFRESCGEDYFLGVAVRSFYLKEINAVTPFVWHNWLAADRLLPACPVTMSLLREFAGEDIVAPYRSETAFWVVPLEDHSVGLSRGYRHGRLGWWHNRVTFLPMTRRLSDRTEVGAISTFCRLALAREPVDRVALLEALPEVGRWERRRTFQPDDVSSSSCGSWPRG